MANVSESLNELAKWGLFLEITGYYDDKFNYLLLYPMMAIIFLVSLIGNSTTFLIIWYDKSMYTTTNYYLSNLAVSDILMTFTMLLEIFGSRSDQKSLFFCKLQWFLIVCLWNNSILTIAALAIERCLAIRHPFKIKPTSTWKRVAKIILLLWLVAIAETSLEMQFLSSVKVHQLTTCFAILTPWARVVHGVLGVITFLIPLLTMTFAYSTILYKVVTSKMDNTKDTIINQQDSIGKISKLVSEYRHISTLKVFLNPKDLPLFLLITVSFFICGTPLFLFRMLLCTLNIDQLLHLTVSWQTWLFVIVISSWISVVLNPILYSVMSTKFRKAVKNIYRKNIKCIT